MSERRTFASALFRPLLWIVVMVLVLGAVVSFALTQSIVHKSSGERFEGTHALFSQMITSSLLTGAYPDVYRRCQRISRDRGVMAVEVKMADGYVVCSLEGRSSSSRRIAISRDIYFDEDAKDRAASVKIVFNDDVGGVLLRQAGFSFGLSVLLLLVLGWVAGRMMAHRLSRPMVALSSEIAGGDLETLSTLGRVPAPNDVEETFVLKKAVSDLARNLLESRKDLVETTEKAAISALAAQVAHDIRSPLAALEVASADAARLSEEQRVLIRSAVGRIRDIANSLLDKQRAHAAGKAGTGGAPPSCLLLSGLIESLITEKRLQYRSKPEIEIDASLDAPSYGIFALVQPVEFKRLLSNLINNAVEAFGGGGGSVRVTLSAKDGFALVDVRDDGKGIPAGLLAKLGQRGETHGKSGGSGLGLHHARTSAESWGGSLKISSEPAKGTTVSVALPQAQAPEWFVSELVLASGRKVVILDDDDSIHKVWDGRLAPLRRHGVDAVHVSSSGELRQWSKENPADAAGARYLLDYELLGSEDTGLSLARELSIGARSILVTSRYEEPAIMEHCRTLGTRMIPKGLAGIVPIRVDRTVAERVRWDAVLIDDDELARATWKVAASRSGKRLRSYSSAGEFLGEADAVDLSTPVYIDVDLAHGEKGDVESLKIHELGFAEIYLATGHGAGKFAGAVHLRGVVGKEPPWSAA